MAGKGLTLEMSNKTAADDEFCDIFPNFRKKGMIFYFLFV